MINVFNKRHAVFVWMFLINCLFNVPQGLLHEMADLFSDGIPVCKNEKSNDDNDLKVT
jgi:hypothetical protein